MKYFLLLLVFVVEANAFFSAAMNLAAINGNVHSTSIDDFEKHLSYQMDKTFENFTPDDVCRRCHPSVRIPLQKVAACVLEKPELVKSLKEDLLQYNMFSIKNSSTEEKLKYCSRHPDGYNGLLRCVSSALSRSHDNSHDNVKVLLTVEKTISLFRSIACGYVDPPKLDETGFNEEELFLHLLSQLAPKYQQYVKRAVFMLRNGIKPSEKDSCLPVRVAEAVVILAISSHQVEFGYHNHIANAAHLVTTVEGGYPYKSFEECA